MPGGTGVLFCDDHLRSHLGWVRLTMVVCGARRAGVESLPAPSREGSGAYVLGHSESYEWSALRWNPATTRWLSYSRPAKSIIAGAYMP